MRWIIRCCHGLHRYQRCVVLCGLIRSSWTDASARTCVPHQKCFARWSLRYEFHAFCLCRSRATRIRSHRMRVYSHWFPFCTVSFCIETSRDLSSDRSNTFSDRSLSISWTIRSLHPCPCFCPCPCCLCPCPCSSDAHRFALAQAVCQCTVVFT